MNKHRGEVELDLAGATLVLRPDFEALAALEAECGKSLTALYRELALHKSSAAIMVAIVRCAGGDQREKGEVWASIVETGILDVYSFCMEFLDGALTGGQEPEGDPTPGEVAAAVEAVKTLSAAAKSSPLGPPSSGAKPSSGKARRTASSARSKATSRKNPRKK